MIIGITGTLGAGKGTVVEYLKTKGFKHFSARAFFTEEVVNRGLPVNRDTITETSNDLRRKFGLTHMIENLFARAQVEGGNVVLESIRTPSEAEFLRSHSALLWGVDADEKTRYERIYERGSETDHISFEKFQEDEAREMNNDDPAKQSIAKVMAVVDHTFYNDGAPEELFAQVDKVLAEAVKQS